jgi:hypothetical protein
LPSYQLELDTKSDSKRNMKMILKVVLLPALLLTLVPMSYADSITLNSAGGTGNFTNGTLQYLGTSPLNSSFLANHNTALTAPTSPTTASGSSASYNVASNGVWTAAIAGTSWVANSPYAGPAGSGTDGSVVDPNDFYYYQTTFTAVGGVTPYDGSISVMADDTLEVLLNGLVIVPFGIVGSDSHCSNGQPSCGTVYTVSLNDISLLSGVNTLTVIDAQTGLNGAGVDLSAHLTETPESSSLLLMGTGLFVLALFLLWKNRSCGLVLHS